MIYRFGFKNAFDGVVDHVSVMEGDSGLLFQPLLEAIVPNINIQKAVEILAAAPNIHRYRWPEFEDYYEPIRGESKEQTLARELLSLILNHARFYSFRSDVAADPKGYKKIEVMLMDDVDDGHQYLKRQKLKDGQILKGTDKRFHEFALPMTPVFSVRFMLAH